MDEIDWLDATSTVDSVQLDIGFIIRDTFYYGEPNNFTPEDWQTLREPLRQPDLKLFGSFALASEVEFRVATLIDHYEDVLRLAHKHGRNIQDQQSYFWLRPLIYRSDELNVSFPWYDTLAESKRFLDSIASGGDGELFWDCDQGWELTVYGLKNRTYIRERNPENGGEHTRINFPSSQLCEQVAVVRERVDRIVRQLRLHFGHDFWSGRP